MTHAASGQLKRTMGLTQATALVVGTIIGASIFVQPSEITGQVPSITGVLLVWLLSGILTLCGALVCAELASAFPRTGGVYVFLSETFSPLAGFLWGWAMFWSMHSGILAAIAVVFARYVAYFVPLGPTGIRVTAVMALLVLSAVNYRGVSHGSRLQTGFTIGKVAAIFLMILAGVALGGGDAAVAMPATPVAASTGMLGGASVSALITALIAGLFAFGGWHMVTYAAGETVAPERSIPRALMWGTLLVTACYIALNAVYMRVLPLEVVTTSTRVAADAADALLGSGGGGFMSALVIFSSFGALSGIVLAGPRVYYSMARDGLLFKWAGEVHPRYQTPHKAIVLQAVWASVLVFTGTYQQLFTRVIYVEWIFFGLMALGLFALRRRPDYRPTYRVGGYPVVPIVFAAASAVIALHRFWVAPLEAVSGLAIVALGLPVYAYWTRGQEAS